ncbi:hypothetical protein Drose_12110 [Dactylosporangium roseum]|uniref:Type VII secretion system protein EccE domain-containing protein n=1 Tax=Dactylosporangium roseum TaxID=47989 RepID=A0ABY5ZF13_9ACTN|nr:type VII secretion protein EccE [Dactylosporangium roseum]UWZ38894.1 hypothetical protein Drose_12110 [Dactylosporangium roseum]
MTQAPTSVRATPPGDDAGSRPRLRRRPGYVGALHIGRLVLIEAVILGIAAALPRGPVVAGVSAFAGILVALVVLLRSHGQWWIERRSLSRQHARRRRARPADGAPGERRLTMLRTLAPGLVIQDAGVAGAESGTRIGIGCDAAGWYAAAVVGPEHSMRGDAEPGVPLDLAARVLDDAEHPGAIVQVTTLSVPAPWQQVDPGQAAARSYRELQQLQQGTPPLPAERTTWVAVRLEARSRAQAGMAGSYDAEHAPALVASLIRKVGRLLREAGLDHHILTADELAAAVSRACELDPAAPGGSGSPREDWTAWRSGELSHAAFWLRGWPRMQDTPAVLDWLTSMPSASSGVSITLTRDDTGLAVRCLLRVSAAGDALEPTVRAVSEAAGAMQAEIVRLDGEHGPAVYACAPTGGGAK